MELANTAPFFRATRAFVCVTGLQTAAMRSACRGEPPEKRGAFTKRAGQRGRSVPPGSTDHRDGLQPLFSMTPPRPIVGQQPPEKSYLGQTPKRRHRPGIIEKRHTRWVWTISQKRTNFGQNDFGYEGQIQVANIMKPDPVQVGQFL